MFQEALLKRLRRVGRHEFSPAFQGRKVNVAYVASRRMKEVRQSIVATRRRIQCRVPAFEKPG